MCAAVDNAGNVLVSTDGGATWNKQLALGSDLTSVSCASTSLCVTGDAAGDVTAFASPVFPLTVFITGEGEVSSAPAGIKCSTEECVHAFEGEVTLTAAKAGAGYEFAGWLGCRKVSATSCTVDVTAASEVTAVFLKAGTEGSTGKEGQPAAKGKPAPPARRAKKARRRRGGSGSCRSNWHPGSGGPSGQGRARDLHEGQRQAALHDQARLRHPQVHDRGFGRAGDPLSPRRGLRGGNGPRARGRMSLRLLPVRPLRPGKYTLTLISGTGRHERIHSEPFHAPLDAVVGPLRGSRRCARRLRPPHDRGRP